MNTQEPPNESMEPNRRFACPLEAEWRPPRLAHAQPFLSAAVAYLKRSAI